MRLVLAFCITAVIALSCKRESSAKTSFNVDSLANAYAELLVLNERYNLAKDSLSGQQYETEYNDVLRAHNYTKDQFVSEIKSAAESPDSFRQLCDRAFARFQEMRKKPAPVPVQGHS